MTVFFLFLVIHHFVHTAQWQWQK